METLIIGKPKIEKLDNRARLCSKISENGKPSYTLCLMLMQSMLTI